MCVRERENLLEVCGAKLSSYDVPVITRSSVNTCQGGGKKIKRDNCAKILAAPSVKRNTDIRAIYWIKGEKVVVMPITLSFELRMTGQNFTALLLDPMSHHRHSPRM